RSPRRRPRGPENRASGTARSDPAVQSSPRRHHRVKRRSETARRGCEQAFPPQAGGAAAAYRSVSVHRRTRGAMNPYENARQAYAESSVLTASREQLVVMLYDGAIRFLRQSAEAMRVG